MKLAMLLDRWVFVMGAFAAPLLGARVLCAQSTPLAVATPAFDSDSNSEWSKLSSHFSACVLALPPDQLKRTEVYLHAMIADSDNSALVVQADLMAQDVAESMRRRMGGASDELPYGDSVVKPWSVPAMLIVTMRADGSATRRAASLSGDTLAASMLLNAFDEVRKNGKALVIWPDGYAVDSLIVRLVLWPTALTRDGSMRMIKATHSRFGVFRILEPIERPARAKPNQPTPAYPYSDMVHRVSGWLLLEFVVDSSGHAVPSTMHDMWPRGKPRLTGELRRYYDDFVEATKTAVATWQFYPASVGSCHVQQIVQLPIAYRIPGQSN